LSAIVDTAIERGHVRVVLELAEMTFIDSAGLSAVSAIADRIASSGGELTVRPAPPQVAGVLRVSELAEVVRFEDVAPIVVGYLGPEQSGEEPGGPVKVDSAAVAPRLRQVLAIPADHDVVDGALRLVVSLTRATVEGADGVSVSLQRHGRLNTVAASDKTISAMDADQYATGEGPCVDASVQGHWFHVESLEQETRWPAFTPRALQLGIRSILSNPILVEERPIGALNIYSRTRAAFTTKEQELASIFATEASTILQEAGADVSDDQLDSRMSTALRTRQIIAMAQGVVMEREGLAEEEAFTLLRSIAQATKRPMVEQASGVVGSIQQKEPRTSESESESESESAESFGKTSE